MSTKQQYNTGVRCGNWFEDSKGAELAKFSMSQRPRMEVSENRTQYVNRFSQLEPSAPVPAGLDAIPGRLVFAHGPNIIDERLPPGEEGERTHTRTAMMMQRRGRCFTPHTRSSSEAGTALQLPTHPG